MNRRVLTVWCPDWPVAAAGYAPHAAVIVLAASRVLARSQAAAVAGVAVGQRRRDAQRRCPEALVVAHDPDRDMRAFGPVLAAVSEFVPRVEVAEAGCLALDARGPARYFGGERRLAEQILTAATAAVPGGAVVRVGVADGRFASAVAARRSRQGPTVVDAGRSAEFLAPQPVAWLTVAGGVDADFVDLLARMGLRHLGDVVALDGRDVLARFGPVGMAARRLAAGTDERPLSGTGPADVRQADRQLDAPVDQVGPLVFVVKQLADRLAGVLAAEGRVCTCLAVRAETEHGEHSERVWYRASGMTPHAMLDRARWQLSEWMDSGGLTAGVVLIRLAAEETRADDGEQLRLWGGPTATARNAARAVTRLIAVVGEDAVKVPGWAGGHLPTDRYRWVPAATVDLTNSEQARARLGPARSDGPWPGTIPPPAPLRVPPTPTPAELCSSDGSAVHVQGSGELSAPPATVIIAGNRQPVSGWAGPWPLHEHSWQPDRQRRAARLQIVTHDGTAYLLLAHHQSWQILGEYL